MENHLEMDNVKELILSNSKNQISFIKEQNGFYNPVTSSIIPESKMLNIINHYQSHDYYLHVILNKPHIDIFDIVSKTEKDVQNCFKCLSISIEESINKASSILINLENEEMGIFRILSDHKNWVYTNKRSENFRVVDIYKEIEFMLEQGCELFFIDRTDHKYIN